MDFIGIYIENDEVITATVLANTSITSRNNHFFFVVSEIYSFSNFNMYNTVSLTIITVLYTNSQNPYSF